MCVRCRRNLLAGERYRLWREGERPVDRVVCALCERAAADEGWVRPTRPQRQENAVGLRNSVRLVA